MKTWHPRSPQISIALKANTYECRTVGRQALLDAANPNAPKKEKKKKKEGGGKKKKK